MEQKIKKGLSLLKRILLSKVFHMRIFYYIAKRYIKVKDKTILYESYHGKSMTGNPYAMYLFMQNDERFKEYTHVWIVEETAKPKKLRNTKFIKRNSLKNAYYLLASKYLINNTTFLPFINKRKKQIYINTWHGIPIKTLGDDITNNYGSGRNIIKNFLQADFLVLPNQYTVEKLFHSFNISNLYPGYIVENGYPRTDLLFKTENDKETLKKELNLFDKKVLLYAPTYRGQDTTLIDEADHINTLLNSLINTYGNQYHILYKGHYFANSDTLLSDIIYINNHLDSNELLNIVDILITDYSSIAFDYLALKKPILYYAYDLDIYSQERGLYFDLHDMPGKVCSSIDSIIDTLQHIETFMSKHNNDYNIAIERFCKYDNGNVTQKIIDAIFFDDRKNINIYKISTNKKKSILLYGGGFLNNGVSSSLFSLLSNLDYNKYEVNLISSAYTNGENFKRMINHIPENVNIIYVNNTGIRLFQSLFKFLNLKRLEKIFIKENYTLFGNTHFHIAIDYSGYGSYWASIIAFSNADLKCIYLHSDIKLESQRRPHLADYNLLFTLFRKPYNRLITVSPSSFKANTANFTDIKHKFVNVNNPIDANTIIAQSIELDDIWKETTDQKKTNFINIARYSTEKGQDRLIKAFFEIVKVNQNVHLYLVGHGSLKDELALLLNTLALTDYITLTDNVENPFPLLSVCDCFILSSHYEGQGLVLLESLVLEIPCISTNIPGPQSILEHGYGLLVEDNVGGLTEGMKKFLQGKVPYKQFDYKQYTDNAMNEFYDVVK